MSAANDSTSKASACKPSCRKDRHDVHNIGSMPVSSAFLSQPHHPESQHNGKRLGSRDRYVLNWLLVDQSGVAHQEHVPEGQEFYSFIHNFSACDERLNWPMGVRCDANGYTYYPELKGDSRVEDPSEPTPPRGNQYQEEPVREFLYSEASATPGQKRDAEKSTAEEFWDNAESNASISIRSAWTQNAAIEASEEMPITPFTKSKERHETLLETVQALRTECGWSTNHENMTAADVSKITMLSQLGHGSVGVVDEVELVLPMRGAVSFVRKRIQTRTRERKAKLELFKKEVHSLRALSHRHVVKIIGTHEGTCSRDILSYSLFTTPAGDGDLSAFLDHGGVEDSASKVTPQAASFEQEQRKACLRAWFSCLASGLAHIHANYIRHQDIKPSDIIYKGLDVYYTDFGSAGQSMVGQTSSTDSFVHATLRYASPEVAAYLDKSHLPQRHDLKSDVFSLGCVYAEMLVVLNGYTVSSFNEYLAAVQDKTPPLYSTVIERIDTWFTDHSGHFNIIYGNCIKPMLAFDRHDRPSALEVLESLRKEKILGPTFCPCYADSYNFSEHLDT